MSKLKVNSLIVKLSLRTVLYYAVLSTFISILIPIILNYFLNSNIKNELKIVADSVATNFKGIVNETYAVPHSYIQITVYDVNKNKIKVINKLYEVDIPYYIDKIFFEKDSNSNIAVYTNIYTLDGQLYYIQVCQLFNDKQIFLTKITSLIIMIFLLSNLGLLFLSILGNKRELKIFSIFNNEIQKISIMNLDKPINLGSNTYEIIMLSESFNKMIDNLKSSIERQNEFISDVTHEIRTPFAIIKGYANMLKRWGYTDKSIMTEAITSINNEIRNIQSLIENLTSLSKLEQKAIKINLEKIQIEELIIKIVDDFEVVYQDVFFDTQIASYTLNTDKIILIQLLRILIDNAIKYSDTEKNITIRGHKTRTSYIIEVLDEGIGIPPKELTNIFNTFYRVEKSRSKQTGGFGLGLSLAKELVTLIDGELVISNREEKGTNAKIVLNFI